jgi:RND family efflux transporter MFP subunit
LGRKRRKTLLLFVFLAGAGVAAGLWWRYSPGRGQDEPGQATAEVVRRDFASTVLATGAVKPQVGAEVRVGARISGKVELLHANIGDLVEKGQVIAELEKADLAAVVRQREAELEAAKTQLQTQRREGPLKVRHAEATVEQAHAEQKIAEASLRAIERKRKVEAAAVEAEVNRWAATADLARKELARQKALYEKKVASLQAVDRAQEVVSTAEAQLAVARKKLELARVCEEEDIKEAKEGLARAKAGCQVAERALSLAKASHEERLKELRVGIARATAAREHAQVQLSYATITASISGTIGSVSTQEGETVAAGLNAPTFVTIIDLKRLQVDAFVDEVDIGKVRVGQRAVFTVDAFPAREFEGKVAAIYPKAVIQDNVVNYDTEVEITTPYVGLLRPEMTANVTIFLQVRKGVLAVPAKAIRRERGKNIVYVLVNGRPEPREVKVGWKDGRWIEVAAGLQEGQRVLLTAPAAGQQNRKAGQ